MSGPDMATAILTVAACIPAVLFPLVFGLTSPWWASKASTAVQMLSTGLGLLVVLSLLRLLFGADYWGRELLRPAVLAVVATGLWMLLLSLLGEKARARRERRTVRSS